jgi:hypothetical protein
MKKPMMVTFVKCPRCCMSWVSPFKHCPRCEPRLRFEEQELMQESAQEGRAMAMDRYAMSMLAVLADGSYVLIRDAYHAVRDGVYESREDLIRDLTAAKKENTELLAENARLRRRLENKTP